MTTTITAAPNTHIPTSAHFNKLQLNYIHDQHTVKNSPESLKVLLYNISAYQFTWTI